MIEWVSKDTGNGQDWDGWSRVILSAGSLRSSWDKLDARRSRGTPSLPQCNLLDNSDLSPPRGDADFYAEYKERSDEPA